MMLLIKLFVFKLQYAFSEILQDDTKIPEDGHMGRLLEIQALSHTEIRKEKFKHNKPKVSATQGCFLLLLSRPKTVRKYCKENNKEKYCHEVKGPICSKARLNFTATISTGRTLTPIT